MSRQIALILIGTLVALAVLGVGWSYLAGVMYYWKLHAPVETVRPFDYLIQFYYYHNDGVYQKPLRTSGFMAAVPFLLLMLFALGLISRKREEIYGSSRFARFSEVARAGLTGDSKGILIGRWGRRYLYYRGNAFVLLAAPTRSGKGVGFVVPNLLIWKDSFVGLDIKMENFNLTSKFRAKYGQEIYLFAPFTEDGRTHRYNPFGYVREGPFAVEDIMSIAGCFYPAGDPKNGMWNNQAKNLFMGLALYLMETPELPFTIGELRRQSTGKGKPIKEYLNGILEERGTSLSETCRDALSQFLSQPDNTMGGTLTTFNAPLNNWASPSFDAATSANDFDLRDVRKRKMSIYIGINPGDLGKADLILNLFFSQLINLNTKELPEFNPELKHKCLLMLDEFTAMGQVEIIGKSNSYFAGYGLQLATIVQSPMQITAPPPEGYGENTGKTLISNHEAQILFTPSKEDSEDYSRFLGTKTIKGRSRQRKMGELTSTDTVSDQKRPLMLPQELQEMSQKKQIIMIRGMKAIFCDKIAYYRDRVFLDRLKEVSPSLKALGRKRPTEKQMQAAMANQEMAVTIPKIPEPQPKAKQPDLPITEIPNWEGKSAELSETTAVPDF
ncbi:type IV secretory system conjugative DNA transfer family protein [Dongshaea marina]|uniref:type IV secretory system conjugative DNA transfer family protein n=1 Tax=Dongshaea marina TaxID=2047966 RepID=UPI000D3ECB9B|nr:type IV secretory system conjugative DNA transfer family protein [Dongshaea marina]